MTQNLTQNGDKPRFLSVSVMAHPSRAQYFDYLRERLGDVPFSIDEKSEGIWPNCKRAWQMFDPKAQYHVVIQDDAIVCNDFYQRAEAAIKQGLKLLPDGRMAFNFYYGIKKALLRQSKFDLERGYALSPYPRWGVAICLPTRLIPAMIAHGDTLTAPQDDVRIGAYLFRHKIPIYFPLPSLINHRTHLETPSLVGDQGLHRQAYAFIDDK